MNDNYKLLLKFCFLLLILSTNITYGQVKAKEAFLQGDYLVIKVIIPSENAPCFSIKRVELLELKSKNKIIAKSLEGSLKDLPTGSQQFLWNYKKDNGYFNGEFDILVYLEACPIKVEPTTVEIITPPKTSSKILLKLLVGSTGIITGVMANAVKSTFDSKVATLTTLENTLSQVNGQFTSQSDLNNWNNAYADAKVAQKTGLLNALIAGSVLSFVYEAYLLARKPPKMNTAHKIFLNPSSGYAYNAGVSLIYRF